MLWGVVALNFGLLNCSQVLHKTCLQVFVKNLLTLQQPNIERNNCHHRHYYHQLPPVVNYYAAQPQVQLLPAPTNTAAQTMHRQSKAAEYNAMAS
jgi:hypothetical protein